MFQGLHIKNFDFKLMFLVIALSVFGIFVIGSADESLQNRQMYGCIVGVVIMLILSVIDYRFILKFYPVIYVLNLVLLALVLFMGENNNTGATRWLKIGGLQFQPSETAKILLILFFAAFIMRHKDTLNTFRILAACALFFAIPWYMVYKQPDLSTSIVLAILFCVILFVGGISYKLVFGALAVVLPAMAILIALALSPDSDFLEDYQRNRILAFINPEEYASSQAYQQLNSVTAIASGQLNGKGYKTDDISSVKNANYLSEEETDFIFAIVGEEFGFKGCIFVIGMVVLIALECFSVARKATQLSGRIIAAGMGGLIFFQSFLNIGVATFILPNTGLPLPFVSYGLTSLLSLYIGMGIVLNIRLVAGKAKKRKNDLEELFV